MQHLFTSRQHSRKLRCSDVLRGAGAEGFEPSTKVLETHVLPLHHAPIAFATVGLYVKGNRFVKDYFRESARSGSEHPVSLRIYDDPGKSILYSRPSVTELICLAVSAGNRF